MSKSPSTPTMGPKPISEFLEPFYALLISSDKGAKDIFFDVICLKVEQKNLDFKIPSTAQIWDLLVFRPVDSL